MGKPGPKLVAVTGVVLLAAVAAGVVVGLGSAPRSSGDDRAARAVAARPGAPTTDAPAGSRSPHPAGRSGTSPTTRSTATSGADTGADTGVETMPETPGSAAIGLPGVSTTGRPHRPSGPPALGGLLGDLPSTAVASRGRIVAGYPARLLPAAPGSGVLTSSVSPSRGRVQVALVAHRSRSGAQVLRFYRVRLAGAGFAEAAVPAVGGARAAAFERDGSQVVVTIDPGPTYSVLATLRVATG